MEKERNDLAHGCYGVDVAMPESIIWVAQTDFITFMTTHETGTDPDALEAYRKKMFVYELGTLERIAQEIAEFYDQLRSFIGYLGSSNTEFRKERYEQLCDQPHIREEMKKTGRG